MNKDVPRIVFFINCISRNIFIHFIFFIYFDILTNSSNILLHQTVMMVRVAKRNIKMPLNVYNDLNEKIIISLEIT